MAFRRSTVRLRSAPLRSFLPTGQMVRTNMVVKSTAKAGGSEPTRPPDASGVRVASGALAHQPGAAPGDAEGV
jgi:hypothetical protein